MSGSRRSGRWSWKHDQLTACDLEPRWVQLLPLVVLLAAGGGGVISGGSMALVEAPSCATSAAGAASDPSACGSPRQAAASAVCFLQAGLAKVASAVFNMVGHEAPSHT